MTPEELSIYKAPTHIAIIMDGNGRWAEKRNLPRLAGHRAGTENLREVISACVEFDVKYLTLYSFSTENWGRPKEEIEGLMRILGEVIERELDKLHKEGVQLQHIGHLEGLSSRLRKMILDAIEMTRNNSKLVLSLAFNYGGRDEIICAVREIVRDGVKPEDITEELIARYLFTAGVPDPDLVIRTSGEMRTSNFLIWQSSYAEWYVTPTLWPDFDKEELRKALTAYGQRDRRYGRISTGS
ncbi:MAG: isoprenyl transferase [Anaerolineaceae bacterium]|nr:isoprenyl transferase [Anaerolineaceae bacterium]